MGLPANMQMRLPVVYCTLLNSTPRVDAKAAMLHILHNDGMIVFKPSRRY